MQFARLLHEGQPVWAIIEGDTAYRVEGDLYASPSKGASLGPAAGLKALNPVAPANKAVCLLGNWGDQPTRNGPGFFVKPSSAMINPGETVIYPEIALSVNLEPELGVIIGKTCSRISAAQAKDHIFGYTVVNDVTSFETVNKDVVFAPLYGKSFDTFGIFGPRVVTDVDPGDLMIRAAINGETFLEINSKLMTWNVYHVISWISQVATLYPGDAIAMGAPPGFNAKNVEAGDTMRISIDGVGVLENPVKRR